MTTQTPPVPDHSEHDTRLAAAPGTWPQADAAWLGVGSSSRARLALGILAVLALSGVAILARPSGSVAAERGPGGAARLPSGPTPEFQLPTPSATLLDAHGLAGHHGIPQPPAHDQDGRASLGIIVGPALFVWVYGGADGVRYSVADLHGQVLAHGLTANEVYGAFPEINLPEMQFGPDGLLCEPIMWAGDDL